MSVKQTLWLIFFLNALDGAFTVIWLSLGIATEANPLLAPFVDNLSDFFIIKVTFPSLMIVGLWEWRKRELTFVLGQFVAFVYTVICLYHLYISLDVLSQL